MFSSKRTRVLQIEQQWCHLGQEPEIALSLAEEQLNLGQKLSLQPGLLAYIALHCVEASSLVFTATKNREICFKGQNYAQIAQFYGIRAYGEESDEAEVFSRITDLWNKDTFTTNNVDLFVVVQEAIAKLRDIDKK